MCRNNRIVVNELKKQGTSFLREIFLLSSWKNAYEKKYLTLSKIPYKHCTTKIVQLINNMLH